MTVTTFVVTASVTTARRDALRKFVVESMGFLVPDFRPRADGGLDIVLAVSANDAAAAGAFALARLRGLMSSPGMADLKVLDVHVSPP